MLEDAAAASLIALWPFSPERSSPFEATAGSELERRIERALAAMPAASREVLLLVGVAGLDHSDAVSQKSWFAETRFLSGRWGSPPRGV